jgi:hypothetical protein
MRRLFEPIVLPAVLGVACIAIAQFLLTQQFYQLILYGAGAAFLGISLWVVTAMVTGWNVE